MNSLMVVTFQNKKLEPLTAKNDSFVLFLEKRVSFTWFKI
jgi:hypothetical protein